MSEFTIPFMVLVGLFSVVVGIVVAEVWRELDRTRARLADLEADNARLTYKVDFYESRNDEKHQLDREGDQ